MALTLRLSPAADDALIRVATTRHLSKNAAAEAAILEADARNTEVDRARSHMDALLVRDAALLARLSSVADSRQETPPQALQRALDALERADLLAELATWTPDGEYAVEGVEWDRADLGTVLG